MYYASTNFPRRSAFEKAVRGGSAVVLFNPALQMPAVNGEVTVVGPWALSKYETRDPRFLAPTSHHGWAVRVRVKDMRVVEFLPGTGGVA